MNINESLTQELESIVRANIEQVAIPYEKGNSIRIKHIIIRKNKHGYQVFNCKTHEHIAKTLSKTGAVAIAKVLAENRPKLVKELIRLDDKIAKHYMDAQFYKRTIARGKDEVTVEAAKIRFELACDAAWTALSEIEWYIFDK